MVLFSSNVSYSTFYPSVGTQALDMEMGCTSNTELYDKDLSKSWIIYLPNWSS